MSSSGFLRTGETGTPGAGPEEGEKDEEGTGASLMRKDRGSWVCPAPRDN